MTLETDLETIHLFERCYVQGFRNLWQILPEIQVYMLSQSVAKKRGSEKLKKITERARQRIETSLAKIQAVYAGLPYERLQEKPLFAPIFTFRNELIPQLNTFVKRLDAETEESIETAVASLRVKVIATTDEFISQLRTSLLELRKHKGYEQYVPHVNVNDRHTMLTDDYLFPGTR